MLSRYRAYLERRRLAPDSIKIRIYWISRLTPFVNPVTARTDDLERFLTLGNWSPASRAVIVSSLHVFYRWLANVERARPDDPSAAIDQPIVRRKVSRIASDDVIRAALQRASLAEQAMLLLGAECGLRVAEIARLSLDDRDDEWLTIIGKGGVERTLHMSPELVAVLDALERTVMRWRLYFPSNRPREHIAPSTVWRHVRALTGVNTHALRHRAGTAAYRGTGNDLRTAQTFLGHSTPVTTAIYVHVERDQLRLASAATRLAADAPAAA